MLDEEYSRLQNLFESAAEGNAVNLDEVFKEALKFFETLKQQIATGSDEEKMQAIQMMTKMYHHIMAETKRITEKSGMTEEQLATFAQNPANFTKEQWTTLQSSKEQIKHVGDAIVEAAGQKEPPSHNSSKPSSSPKDLQGKRSKWMRS